MRKHLKSACITVLLMIGALLSHISAWAENPPPLLWSRTNNVGAAVGVAVDSGNNIITVGYNGGDWLICKYDPAGNLLWSQTYSIKYYSIVTGVVVDGGNNIIAVGYTYNNSSNTDCLIRKYDSAGNLLWSQTYDGGIDDIVSGVATDTSGNIVVVGYTDNGATYDWVIRKYSADGSLLWSQIYDGEPIAGALGVATDTSGNIIAVGATYNASYHSFWLIRKYGAEGNLLWSQTYGGWEGNENDAWDVATDNQHNIIVVGNRIDNWLIRKYSADGVLLWNQTFGGRVSDNDINVTTDSSNNIIVVADSSNGTNNDWVIRKYSADGSLLWSQIYDSGTTDSVSNVATDSSDNIIAVGYANNNCLIRKYGVASSTAVTPAINNPTPQQNETICVQVNIADVNNLYAAGFNLSYNPAVLDYTGITEGTFLNSNGQVSTSLQAAALNGDEGSGQIVVGISRMGDVSGASGSGRLATLCFNVIGNYCSTSDISFGEANLEGPAQDSLITAAWNNGSLTVTMGSPANPVTNDPGTHNRIDLCWDSVSGAASYEVYRSNTPGGAYALIGTTADTCYQDTGCILPTRNYYYQVKALSGGTCVSALSPEVYGVVAGLLGDINNDGRVNGRDLSRLARNFGTANDCRSDLDRSGLIDGEDLILLASDFGRTL